MVFTFSGRGFEQFGVIFPQKSNLFTPVTDIDSSDKVFRMRKGSTAMSTHKPCRDEGNKYTRDQSFLEFSRKYPCSTKNTQQQLFTFIQKPPDYSEHHNQTVCDVIVATHGNLNPEN
ncbi:hypothetical protein CDAR_567911 [Caerostris darwini]|uniref:Uncharacterized protein n=1 Tax=Caerostris darwini TaxID=1538125 RepID=A0AAV4SHY4_9ARAC|nr:hypothetical protein CDAR_567911 [Caerostris darwini]